MKKVIIIWAIAFVLTVFLAAYQRITGPSYPVSGEAEISGKIIEYKFDRTHGGEGNHTVKIKTDDEKIKGTLYWKRYKTEDEWTAVEMKNENNTLSASLPHQPAAGKLMYFIKLDSNGKQIKLPEDEPVIIRFKGAVPVAVLIPHIFFIFGAMFLSTRTGLEYFNQNPNYKKFTMWTFFFLIVGGFILGPIAQYYAFGEFWTGFPYGIDLTDNKVLIALIGWIAALIAIYKSQKPHRWVIFASLLMFIIYLIPHSLLGSELDYNELDKNKIEINQN